MKFQNNNSTVFYILEQNLVYLQLSHNVFKGPIITVVLLNVLLIFFHTLIFNQQFVDTYTNAILSPFAALVFSFRARVARNGNVK